MAKIRKIIAMLVATAMIITIVLNFGISAMAETSAEDFVLADFSLDDSAKAWKSDPDYVHNNNLRTDVARMGKEKSLWWGEHLVGETQKNCKLESPKLEGVDKGLGKLISYKYMVIWMYSDKANGQNMNAHIYDSTTGSYNQNVITVNWSGWKPVIITLKDRYTLSSFDKDGTAAAATDKWYILFQTRGWSKQPLADTLLYVDSIYLTNDDPTQITAQTEPISSEIKNGMRDIVPTTKEFTITANKLFKEDRNYYKDFVEVYGADGSLMTYGTDYTLSHELNKMSVKFVNALTEGSTYKVVLKKEATMNEGASIGLTKDYSVEFTINQIEFDIDETDFNFGGITAPPASGTVSVSLHATNEFSSSVKARLFVGVYDKTTNQMKKLTIGEEVTISSGGSDTFEATVDLDEITGYVAADSYIRAFLLTNETDMYSFGAYGELR